MDAPPVQYVTTSDGKNIAYTVGGTGPPLVFVPNQISHVLLSWQLPTYGPWLRGLTERFTLVRFDLRGCGMSSRGLGDDHLFDHYQIDLEAVLQRLGWDRFVMIAQGSGCGIAVQYAVLNPERVRALILIGAGGVAAIPAGDLLFRDLPRRDWDAFLRTIAAAVSRAPEDAPRVAQLLKQCVTQEDWLRSRGPVSGIDENLALLRVPVLVLHPRDYFEFPIEASMKSAQLSRGQLVLIDGRDHLGDRSQGIDAIAAFLAGLPAEAVPHPASPDGLSRREMEVLHLIAAGRSNQQIADELVISVNTVNRHVSNIFDKTGVANRAQATAYAKDNGLA